MKVRVGIAGASGFSGGELLRILLSHHDVEVSALYSHSEPGASIADVHPQFLGQCDLKFSPVPREESGWSNLDLLFLCLPHGVSSSLVPTIPPRVKVIDLAGDFRLKDPRDYLAYYGDSPPDRDLQAKFIYGLVEWERRRLVEASYVASPGCFATATILGLAPLVASNLIEERVIVDAKTGSTGSGIKPTKATLHASRVHSLVAYKAFNHQHVPEIKQALSSMGRGKELDLIFQTHSTPLVRGIYATIYTRLRADIPYSDIESLFQSSYRDSPFVRFRGKTLPDVSWCRGTNFVDLGLALSGRNLIIFSALDNLVKGAAGQAVQAMNVMFGFNESQGLCYGGGMP